MKAVDLFCGCGGMSLGFQNVGIEVLAAFDNWEPAINIYKDNFQHPVHNIDLKNADAVEQIRAINPEMIIGGPPCQDFSIAGSRNMGERANLTICFANIVSEVKPTWFVMENVYNIERMPILPQAREIFKKAGYGITVRILNASHCGVPQARRRFFMIGLVGAQDDFLGRALDLAQTKLPMTVRDYLGETLQTQFYYMHPRSYNRRAVFSIDEPSATIRGVNRPIPQGYKKHPGDKANPTDGCVRDLTTKERSYLQTFPEGFLLEGKKTDVEQAMLFRSLTSAMRIDGFGISDLQTSNEDTSKIEPDDIQNGYIYVLRSLSRNPQIRQMRNLYKIGYCSGDVTTRIQNAAKEPTYGWIARSSSRMKRIRGVVFCHLTVVWDSQAFRALIANLTSRTHEHRGSRDSLLPLWQKKLQGMNDSFTPTRHQASKGGLISGRPLKKVSGGVFVSATPSKTMGARTPCSAL